MAPTTTCSCPCCCFAPTTTADRSSQGPTRLLSNDFGIKRPTTFRHSSRESVSTGCPPDTSGRGNPLYVAISCRLRRRAISAVPSRLTVHWPAPCRASSSGWRRGLRLKGADDHRLDPGILDRARRSRSRLVPKTFKLGEAPTPLADRVGINNKEGRYDLALFAFSTGQDDPSPQREALRRCVYRELKLGRSGGEVRQGWRVI